MSSLRSWDRARATGVCRKWGDIAKSLKKNNRPPTNVHVRENNELVDICDLSRCLSNRIIFPNRPPGVVCYAKGGWMLFHDDDIHAMNFYNPQSNEVVELPKILSHDLVDIAAFSAPPTSPNYTVFLLLVTFPDDSPDVVIWRPGDMAWTNVEYSKRHRSITSTWVNVVVRNGNFYCMNIDGYIGEFDPVKCSLRALPYEPLRCARSVPSYGWRKSVFMAEYDGDSFYCALMAWRNP
ncbi:F-box/kelch-repeat protein At1g57790-like [Andrographis paniculata]|uniref:F-box/kelch-repeat protein At1g57790-like n=1 Tax=Andrographis paniculata TaxID=175694 RepID=UPI0021E86A8B|nr:F-box/kelch-repeat protein At1g57790-like [Andrographis paniculata]